MTRYLLYIALLLGAVGDFVQAEGTAGSRTIRLMGRKENTVSTQVITLADIARIHSSRLSDDDAVIALNKISLGKSPLPGERLTLTASQILERLQEEGVQLDTIGYALPRVISVERAYRAITFEEVDTVIREALPKNGDSEILEVLYDQSVKVAPGAMSLSAEITPSNIPGRHIAKLSASVKGESPVRFHVPISVKEWIEVPVAKRPLPKGSVVSSYDLVMARAELSDLPLDAARDSEQILGHEIRHPIGYGEVFRKGKLAIPPMVDRGARVTLLYKTELLEASASGVALEEGIEGQSIRVRNDNSNKTVTGQVISPGLIRVNP